MLRAAVLGALADVKAGFVRIDPHMVDAVGNQVRFSREIGHPEAVVGVGGKQSEESG